MTRIGEVHLPVPVELLDATPRHADFLHLNTPATDDEPDTALVWTAAGVDLVVSGRVKARLRSHTIWHLLRWALEADAKKIEEIRQAELEVISMARQRAALHRPPEYLVAALAHLDQLVADAPASRL